LTADGNMSSSSNGTIVGDRGCRSPGLFHFKGQCETEELQRMRSQQCHSPPLNPIHRGASRRRQLPKGTKLTLPVVSEINRRANQIDVASGGRVDATVVSRCIEVARVGYQFQGCKQTKATKSPTTSAVSGFEAGNVMNRSPTRATETEYSTCTKSADKRIQPAVNENSANNRANAAFFSFVALTCAASDQDQAKCHQKRPRITLPATHSIP
jgi:hypothetical protein